MKKVDEIMELAQVFASAWASVGGPFDNGQMLTNAEDTKAELRKAIEALAQPAGEAEPVAIYRGRCIIDCGEHGHHDIEMLKLIPAGSKLYTTPQQSQPLTDERIHKAWSSENGLEDCDMCKLHEFTMVIRFVEQLHNIKKGGTE
jgi:hypothetical protein